MKWPKFKEFREFIGTFKKGELDAHTDDELPGYTNREKVVVFLISFVLALGLWMMVNLSRNFNLNIDLPIQVEQLPTDQALAQSVPSDVSVSVSGEGWKLITLYNQPPTIQLALDDQQINLYDEVREQMNVLPEVEVLKTAPMELNIDMEPKISKKVPVVVNTEIKFRNRYDIVGKPKISPDSIIISGAKSRVNLISSWATETLQLEEVSRDIDETIALHKPTELISLSRRAVGYQVEVSEYTEGELRTFIRTRNLPEGEDVTYSPSVITIKYDVPINEYARAQEIVPYKAFVNYDQIENDTTGYVSPNITPSTQELHLKLRNYSPQSVAYYNVVQR